MVSVCIIGIENPGNAGAIARGMKNFGLKKLYFINPQCDFLCEEARQRAMGGIKILEASKEISLEKLKKFDTIIGTSAILGNDHNIPRNSLTVKEFFSINKDLTNAIIIFGRESCGLTNREIEICDFLINIPASLEYNTLNISHAAIIIFYELYNSEVESGELFPFASRREKELLLEEFKKILNELPFKTENFLSSKNEEKIVDKGIVSREKKTQELVWKRLISKSFLTRREAFALFGLLKKIKDKINNNKD